MSGAQSVDFGDIPMAPAVDFGDIPKAAHQQPQSDALLQNIKSMGDVAIGAFKQPGRLVQMIPGVTAATDALFSLPKGSSEAAMQPTNAAQKIGGYTADAAEVAAGLGADSGMVYTRNAAGQFVKAPFMQSVGGKIAQEGAEISRAAVRAAAGSLLGSGPITPASVGAAVGRYGVAAVKLALSGLGLKAGWDAYEAIKQP